MKKRNISWKQLKTCFCFCFATTHLYGLVVFKKAWNTTSIYFNQFKLINFSFVAMHGLVQLHESIFQSWDPNYDFSGHFSLAKAAKHSSARRYALWAWLVLDRGHIGHIHFNIYIYILSWPSWNMTYVVDPVPAAMIRVDMWPDMWRSCSETLTVAGQIIIFTYSHCIHSNYTIRLSWPAAKGARQRRGRQPHVSYSHAVGGNAFVSWEAQPCPALSSIFFVQEMTPRQERSQKTVPTHLFCFVLP